MNHNSRTPDHSARIHAEHGPSSLEAKEFCPGYVSDDSGPPHPVTEAGTRIHEAIEARNPRLLQDKEERELAGMCLAYLEEVLGKYDRKTCRVYQEVKVTAHEDIYGFLDLLVVDKDHREGDLIDWKTGFNPVTDAESNLQGQAYLLGVANKWPTLEKVTVHFPMPRLGKITKHEYDVAADLPAIRTRVRSVRARIRNADPGDFRFHPQNCQYCARHDCPKLAEFSRLLAPKYAKSLVDFRKAQAILAGEEEDDTKRWEEKEADAKALVELAEHGADLPADVSDPERISKMLAVASVMERWASSVKRNALDMRLTEGIEIPGYDLVHRRSKRSVTDPDEAYEAVKEHVSEEEFRACTTVSVAKLEDVFKDKGPESTKKKNVAVLDARLQDRGILSGGNETPMLVRSKEKQTNK